MAVEIEPRREATSAGHDGPFAPLRRGLFVWFVLPVVMLYPLLYLPRDDGERERLARQTAFAAVPGLSADSWLPAVGYGACFLLLVFLVSAVAVLVNPFGSAVAYAAAVGTSVLVGSWATLALNAVGLDRSLAKRLAAVVPVAFLFGSMVAVLAAVAYPRAAGYPSATLVPPLAVLVGALAGNGYLVKTLDREQRLTGPEEGDEHRHTDEDAGTEVDEETGRELVAELGRSVWVAPDDLGKRCEVVRTRRIATYRDVEQRLRVGETRRSKEVALPRFSRVLRRHRTDYHDREAVAPDGFVDERYTFFVPDSKRTRRCGRCSADGVVDCSRCGAAGRTTCRSCSGSGRDDCSSCGGDGRRTVRQRCKVCGGMGEQCMSCGGSGTVRETETCSSCGGSGEETCSRCSGAGEVTCSRCDGSGIRECGHCEGSGRRVRYEYVVRRYTADEEVSYRLDSVPEAVVSDAEGSLERQETVEDPDGEDLYRYREAVYEVPVVATTYRYRGDVWELFGVEGDVEALEYPRDFRKQFRIVQACAVPAMPTMVLLMFL